MCLRYLGGFVDLGFRVVGERVRAQNWLISNHNCKCTWGISNQEFNQ